MQQAACVIQDQPLALGIDVGTTNIKVALVGWGPGGVGHVVNQATEPTPRTPGELLAATANAVARCLAAPTVTGPVAAEHRIVAVGVSSMAETGVGFDAQLRPLTPLVMWDDARATDILDDFAELGASDRAVSERPVHEHNVLDRSVFDCTLLDCTVSEHALPGRAAFDHTLFERTGVRVGPKPPLAKWRWFARNEPGVWQRLHIWLGAADLVVHALTGEFVTDHTLAGRTGALPLDAHDWDPDLTQWAGLRPHQLPRVCAPGEVAGPVRPGPLADAGIPVNVPVYVAGHDHAVGAYAAGCQEVGDVANSLGTSQAVYAVVEQVPPEWRGAIAAQGMSIVRTVDGRHHAVVGGSPASGRLIDWWCRQVATRRTPQTVFDHLDRAAAPGVLVLPYPAGRQAPAPDPDARLVITGLGLDDDDAVLAEALCRGLVLHTRWMIDAARAVGSSGAVGGPLGAADAAGWRTDGDGRCAAGGASPGMVTVLGGPTANTAWVRRMAELWPWPVRLVTEPDAVAAGAGIIAAQRAGFNVSGLARVGVEADPDPRAGQLYGEFRRAAGHPRNADGADETGGAGGAGD